MFSHRNTAVPGSYRTAARSFTIGAMAERFRGTALITGASGGIGYELAKLFARDGHNLVLVARNGAALDKLAEELSKAHNICTLAIGRDLTEPSAARETSE